MTPDPPQRGKACIHVPGLRHALTLTSKPKSLLLNLQWAGRAIFTGFVVWPLLQSLDDTLATVDILSMMVHFS